MSARMWSPKLVWEPIPSSDGPAITAALEAVLARWRRTPYESGQRFCGRAADCIGSVFGVIDDLDGQGRAQFPGMPRDVSMHNRESAVVAMRELVRRYAPCRKLEPGEGVQPGDVLATGEPGGGPGHVELVGPQRNTLWHSTKSAGFHQSGWSLLQQQVLWAVYRIENKELWIR